MIKYLYSVRDDVSEVFNDPMFEANEAFAKRRFHVMMRTLPEGVYPGEFSLWKIGYFDDSSGNIGDCEPTMIMRGVSDAE